MSDRLQNPSHGPMLGLVMAIVAGLAVAMLVGIRIEGMLGLLGVIGVVTAVVCFTTHPLVPWTLYFGAIFFKDTNLSIIPMSANQIFALLFLFAFCGYWLRHPAWELNRPLLITLAVAVVYFTLSAALGEDTKDNILHARYVVLYFIMAATLAGSLKSERSFLAMAWIVALLTGIAGIDGLREAVSRDLLSSFTGNWGNGFRVKSTAANSVVYGWNMMFGIPFVFFLFSELKLRRWRLLALMMAGLALAGASVTFNRQTYVLILLVLVLCAIMFRYKNRAVLLGLITGLGILAAATVLPLIIKRMLSVASLSRDYSFLEHKDSVLIGQEMFRRHPVTGVGLGAFPAVWPKYIPPDYSTFFIQYRERSMLKYPDFGYMEILSETGLLGLAIYLFLNGFIVIKAWKIRRRALKSGDMMSANYATLILMLMVLMVTSSAIQDTFLYPRVWIIFGLALLLDEKILGIDRFENRALLTESTALPLNSYAH